MTGHSIAWAARATQWLSGYISDDDAELSREQLLRIVAERILDDLPTSKPPKARAGAKRVGKMPFPWIQGGNEVDGHGFFDANGELVLNLPFDQTPREAAAIETIEEALAALAWRVQTAPSGNAASRSSGRVKARR